MRISSEIGTETRGSETMRRYVTKRILLALLTVAVALVINFLLVHLAPGDPTQAGGDPAGVCVYGAGAPVK